MIKGLSPKYGFERAKDLDFSDDGNHFICYTYKGYRVSYLHKEGDYYISPSIGSNLLTYEEELKLPHFRTVDRLNGIYNATEEDITQLIKDMDALIDEIKEAESKVDSEENINAKYTVRLVEEYKYKKFEYDKMIDRIQNIPFDKLCQLSEYDFKHLREYVNSAKAAVDRALNAKPGDYSISTKRINLERSVESTSNCYYIRYINEILDTLF